MSALSDMVRAIAAHAGSLEGVRAAPETMTQGVNLFPFALTYPAKFDQIDNQATYTLSRRITVRCELHCARQLTPIAVAQATLYGDTFPAALWNDPSLNDPLGAPLGVLGAVRGVFGWLQYGDTPTVGWQFEIDIDRRENI